KQGWWKELQGLKRPAICRRWCPLGRWRAQVRRPPPPGHPRPAGKETGSEPVARDNARRNHGTAHGLSVYHEATVREMSNTLFFFGKELNRHKWPQKISRAIVTSGALSGIELRYHSKNAERPVSVDDFLASLQHWQILPKDKGIDIYNTASSQARLKARANLEAEYKDYLASAHREKPIEAVQHDMTVLETVQSLRTNAKTTLDAGSLLVTCDYHLFRFDYEHSWKNDRHHSTVLPILLWQI